MAKKRTRNKARGNGLHEGTAAAGARSRVSEEEMVLIPLSVAHGRWLCHLMAQDLAAWRPGRPTQLKREEGLSFAWFMHDLLPGNATAPSVRRPTIKRQIIN